LPRHGAVAPDAPLRDGTRLKQRFGSRFVVLLAAAPPAFVVSSREARWPAPVDVVADDGLSAAYGTEGPRAWIVRPDGHLASSLSLTEGAATRDLERLVEMVGRAAGRERGSAPG
jgi:hypothetical protein